MQPLVTARSGRGTARSPARCAPQRRRAGGAQLRRAHRRRTHTARAKRATMGLSMETMELARDGRSTAHDCTRQRHCGERREARDCGAHSDGAPGRAAARGARRAGGRQAPRRAEHGAQGNGARWAVRSAQLRETRAVAKGGRQRTAGARAQTTHGQVARAHGTRGTGDAGAEARSPWGWHAMSGMPRAAARGARFGGAQRAARGLSARTTACGRAERAHGVRDAGGWTGSPWGRCAAGSAPRAVARGARRAKGQQAARGWGTCSHGAP